jgi:S1-C subfamily serine protease
VRRLSLGVSATAVELPRRIVRELDLLTERAVQAVEIISGGPAHAAGLARGDLIVAVNARVVTGVDDLHRLLAGLPLDRAFTLSVVRGEELLEISVEPRLAGSR